MSKYNCCCLVVVLRVSLMMTFGAAGMGSCNKTLSEVKVAIIL